MELGATVTGDGYSVILPAGFEGGHTDEEIRQGVEAAFHDNHKKTFDALMSDGRTDLFAADPPPSLQRTILFTEFSAVPVATLDEIASAYTDKVVGSGVTLLETSETQIDGHPVTVVSYEDPSSGVRTDAYVYLQDAGKGWIMEYSAPAKSFDQVDDAYRRSVESFSPS